MNLIFHACDKDAARNLVQAHRYLFHEMGLPVIADADFDALLCHAQKLIAPNAAALDWRGVDYTETQKLLAMHLLMDF